MKVLIQSIVLFSFMVIFAYAQPRYDSKRILENLKQELNLTGEQEVEIGQILSEAENTINSWDRGTYEDRSEFREKRMTLMKETDEKIMLVLNAEQKVKYEKYVAERRQRRPRGNRDN